MAEEELNTNSELAQAVKRKPSFLQTLQAVLWSFLGIRKGREHAADMANLNPIHVIIAGLLAACVFVVSLILIVRQVVAA